MHAAPKPQDVITCATILSVALRSASRSARLAGTARSPRRAARDRAGRRRSTSTRPSDRYVHHRGAARAAREQIELAVEDNRLTIRGRARRAFPTSAARQYHQVERGHGSFSRTFEFADAIDEREHHRRSARRRADGHAPEGPGGACRDASTCSRGSHEALRRFSFVFVTSRLRRRHGPDRPDADRRRVARRETPAAGSRSPAASPSSAGCRISPAWPRSAIPSVMNISSLQVVRAQNSPFANDPLFQLLLRRSDDVSAAQPDRRRASAPA